MHTTSSSQESLAQLARSRVRLHRRQDRAMRGKARRRHLDQINVELPVPHSLDHCSRNGETMGEVPLHGLSLSLSLSLSRGCPTKTGAYRRNQLRRDRRSHKQNPLHWRTRITQAEPRKKEDSASCDDEHVSSSSAAPPVPTPDSAARGLPSPCEARG